MRAAFICPPLTGHAAPTLALAGEMRRRGHVCAMAWPADFTRLDTALSEAGVERLPLLHPKRPSTARLLAHLDRPSPPFGVFRIAADMAATFRATCAELPAMLREFHADVLIADEMEPAAGLVARSMGLRHVSLATALALPTHPAAPPFFLDWPFDASEEALAKHRVARRISDVLLFQLNAAISDQARQWGLNARRLEDCLSDELRLSQSVATFDFPHATPRMVQTGPLRDASVATEVATPPGEGPLVFCSLGTLQGHRFDIFRAVAQACETLGARLLVAHGGKLADVDARRLPGRTLAVDFVDHRSMFAIADLVVCHAGQNTILDALSAGAPLVAMPIGFEQPGAAARVRAAGVGVVTSPRSARRLQAAIATVLGDGRYRRRAMSIAEDIRAAGGVRAAADAIETLIASAAGATTAFRDADDARDDIRSEST